MTKRIESTAYHEAGHAVKAIEYRRRFKYVTVIPGDGTLGHLKPGKWSCRPDIDSTSPGSRLKIEREIIIDLGGLAAEYHYRGKHSWSGAQGDIDRATNRAFYLFSNVKVVGRYLDYMIERVKSEIRQWPTWPAVEAVAKALLTDKTLSYRRARLIAKEAHNISDTELSRLYDDAA
jgi:hypothetical protein